MKGILIALGVFGFLMMGLLAVFVGYMVIDNRPSMPDWKPNPIQPKPSPPIKPPCPDWPRRPNANRSGWLEGGKIAPVSKEEVHIDLPDSLHLKNVGGSDGAGLCVFTSISHAARWQNVPLLENFRDWMRKYPGGGWPEKVKKKITEIAKEKGVEEPLYLQVEGNDFEILKRACENNLMPSVTYSYSPDPKRYGGQRIAHMVNLVHASDTDYCVLDNNFPGSQRYQWMTPREFEKAYTGGSGTGWSVILLNPGPPKMPRN